MEKEGLTKTAMAARMRTSRRALDRLLDPRNTSVTLHTMQKAAAALGRSLRLQLATGSYAIPDFPLPDSLRRSLRRV